MIWIAIAVSLMVISFIANVMLTQECNHHWEERGDGFIKCKKCKKQTRARSYVKSNSSR
jgi:tRNA(Ile2) C34 agmatinyltransferase TiaS